MLLRTSSAPVLSSLINPCLSLADSCKDSLDPPLHVHSSHLSFFHSLGTPSSLPGRASLNGHGICAVDNSDEGELDLVLPPLQLSRVQSEGHLACFSTAMAATAPGKHGFSGYDATALNEWTEGCRRVESHHVIPEENDESDQCPPASCCAHLHPFSPNRSDAISDPKFAHALVLSDGESYSTFRLSPLGSPVACNGKGCRPLTHSECKELGFLDMASGVGSGVFVQDEGEAPDVSDNREAYYQSVLQNDPENPLLLHNYAQFLSKKGDVKKAEEYYERAILADPGDGEVLSHYAKLQWDVHRDQDRAETYYDQAVKAAPEDCYVLASYASFLWDVEDDDASTATQALPAYSETPIDSLNTLLASAESCIAA